MRGNLYANITSFLKRAKISKIVKYQNVILLLETVKYHFYFTDKSPLPNEKPIINKFCIEQCHL